MRRASSVAVKKQMSGLSKTSSLRSRSDSSTVLTSRMCRGSELGLFPSSVAAFALEYNLAVVLYVPFPEFAPDAVLAIHPELVRPVQHVQVRVDEARQERVSL